ncbi:hypothetical protein JMK98_08290 [Pediococcus pentosaceus]|uniref:hypothetical protein n=1 Tax=Pediococcus pentosaceus TaxID=1255 RepID=UPI0019623EC9|nr:hypothetical protein [Pediococcus pentosaceus]MBM9930482.1 hypothetical protein [Pediococcus pentosaceus]
MDNKISWKQNHRGALINLRIKNDESKMNWVIDPDYLEEVGYGDKDKLFGEFTLTISGEKINSIDLNPKFSKSKDKSVVSFNVEDLLITETYINTERGLKWNINVKNLSEDKIELDNLGVWTSLAYVMYRDKNIMRNANQSAAVFSSISPDFTKLAAVRRDNTSPNLGMYQTDGKVLSVGTYNEYSNRFFENVSPSLDGLLFHQLVLAGGYDKKLEPKNDWIYSHQSVVLDGGEQKQWEFYLAPFTNQENFYEVGRTFGHPRINFAPLVSEDEQMLSFDRYNFKDIESIFDQYKEKKGLKELSLNKYIEDNKVKFPVNGMGEHKVTITFKNGKQDMVVFNKMKSIQQLLRDRAEYISEVSYQGADGKVPYSFSPISNQGESLGKMNFVLQECLLDPGVKDINKKIRQVEKSAVKYVRPKWFVDGDFKQPKKLYGDFYRVMDLEYIAHLFYLLSQCDDKYLQLHTAKEYLLWAGEVFDVRVNSKLHNNERGKEEAQMLGQYFLYVEDLLKKLKENGLTKEYEEIASSWKTATDRVDRDSTKLTAAMTEHFFDNAGFGPAAGALALSGHQEGAKKYGELLKANIGFSNDFRAQSPDRWWEALSYMMHALWGGVTAAAAVITGRELGDIELVKAGYRGTVALLYMYDSNATATDRLLKPGEAASTYSIAGPNLNRPDLSRNRFGQSIFSSNGGIFTRLFPDGYTGEDDWDMGEELVAYLNGLGQETYLYENSLGDYEVINGKIEQLNEKDLKIKSSAPYPTRYINLNTMEVLECKQERVTFSKESKHFMM